MRKSQRSLSYFLLFFVLTMGHASPRGVLSVDTVALHMALGTASGYNKGRKYVVLAV